MTREMTLFNKWEATITWPASMLSGGKEHKQTCPLPTRAHHHHRSKLWEMVRLWHYVSSNLQVHCQ